MPSIEIIPAMGKAMPPSEILCSYEGDPMVFRLTRWEKFPLPSNETFHVADIFGYGTASRIGWISRVDWYDVRPGELVHLTVTKSTLNASEEPFFCGLEPVRCPRAEVDLLNTVPPGWVTDHVTLELARNYLDGLPPFLAKQANYVLWDSERLKALLRRFDHLMDY